MVHNKANFQRFDILRLLYRINSNKSRNALAKELELGEGSIRSILEILKKKCMIKSSNKGHVLTEKGNEILNHISNQLKFPVRIRLSNFKKHKSAAIVIKNYTKKFSYKERDIAVKNGAEGALLMRNNCTVEGIKFPEISKKISAQKDDLIITCFADNYRNAENACISVAESLILKIKKAIGSFN